MDLTALDEAIVFKRTHLLCLAHSPLCLVHPALACDTDCPVRKTQAEIDWLLDRRLAARDAH